MVEYLQRHFVDHATFVRRSGGSVEQVEELLEAKAAPGVVYSQSPDGEWWSALSAYIGTAPPNPPIGGRDWYAPSAIWWVRRAMLMSRMGGGPMDMAAKNVETFGQQFFEALASVAHASRNYPSCFEGAALNDEGARKVALSEWGAWTSGAYAVCLSHFSGESCVRKEVGAWRIRNHFEGQDKSLMLADAELFDLTEELAFVLMPFAPFERASGTPGKAIDRTLALLGLGSEEPY